MGDALTDSEKARRPVWRRRVFLVLLPASLAVALLTGIVIADRGEETPSRPAEELPPAPDTRGAARGAGGALEVERPRGWREAEVERGVRLRARDGTAELTVVAVTGPGERRAVLADTLDALRESYRSFERVRGPEQGEEGPRRISDRPALTRGFAARTPDGEDVRGLLATVSAAKRTWVVQVVTAADAPAERVVEAQVAVSSIELG